MSRILIVDDEDGIREYIAEALETEEHQTVEAGSAERALAELGQNSFDLMLTDLKMPGMDGLALVKRAKELQPDLEVVVLTAHGSIDAAVEAMKLGAFDFLQKPVSAPAELRLLVQRALERRALLSLKETAQRNALEEPDLTSRDPTMRDVIESLKKVARTATTVLFVGESGTGKEVAARYVHRLSQRSGGPFVAINCAALSENLLESELFGHEKGAFTGAHAARRGRIELASGGTFFLDEVGELKPDLQVKLLRVIQEKSFERVGGSRTFRADVRWIAATNRDLQTMVADGRFREDLYHRLSVFPIRLPPLRDRRADIPDLTRALLAKVALDVGKSELRIDDEAIELLSQASWPGNVRELRNTLERAAILADGTDISAHHVVLDSIGARPDSGRSSGGLGTLEELERRAIADALVEVGGNRKKAAELLGIGVRTLYEKLKRYSLG